jgi:hypothetical protein
MNRICSATWTWLATVFALAFAIAPLVAIVTNHQASPCSWLARLAASCPPVAPSLRE